MSETDQQLIQSIQNRLKAHSRATGQNYEDLLYYYAIERFLYRLSRSPYREHFVLKGALIFAAWGVSLGRPTRDIDLRGYTSNDVSALVEMVRSICRQPVEDDGLWFDADQVQGEEIREEDEYHGVRVRFLARLGNSRVRMQLDIGFSDVITPADRIIELPTILGMPAPVLRGYPTETVVAEKLQTLVIRGELNSRVKDFFDLWQISRLFAFEGRVLQQAIRSTFAQRATEIPAGPPLALTPEFAALKQEAWQRFLRPLAQTTGIPPDLAQIITDLQPFLLPPLQAAAQGQPFTQQWPAGGPWKPEILI